MGRTAPESYVNGPYGWGGYIEGYSGSDTNLIIPAPARNGSYYQIVYSAILGDSDLDTVSAVSFEPGNEIKQVELSSSRPFELDASGLTELQDLTIEAPLTNDALGLTESGSLTEVTLSGCGVSTIVLGNQPNLKNLTIEACDIESLDPRGFPNLNSVTLVDCPRLTSIDLSRQSKMRSFTAERTPLKGIDLAHCDSLIWLNLTETDIEVLDLRGLEELGTADVSDAGDNDGVRRVIVGDGNTVGYLAVTSAQIETLELGDCTIESITVCDSGNTRNDIDISGCLYLRNLNVEGNAFSAGCREAIRQHPNWGYYWVY